MSKSEITLAIIIDYSKAFDTIDHKTLIPKLIDLNFSFNTIKIMHSYLTDRSQFVQVDDKSSSMLPMYYVCIPQGSILGPVLFNLYVMDLADKLKFNTLQYADDTTIYKHCKAKDIKPCAEALEAVLNQLSKWSNDQNLIFNDIKTKCLLFSTTQMSAKLKLEIYQI